MNYVLWLKVFSRDTLLRDDARIGSWKQKTFLHSILHRANATDMVGCGGKLLLLHVLQVELKPTLRGKKRAFNFLPENVKMCNVYAFPAGDARVEGSSWSLFCCLCMTSFNELCKEASVRPGINKLVEAKSGQ